MTALDVALAYHDAWTSKNFERAMTYIADDIVCDAPAERIEGAGAYRDFMGPFVEILRSARLLAWSSSRSREGRSRTAASSSTGCPSRLPARRPDSDVAPAAQPAQ
jgi:SnoaL-like domain